MIRSLAIMILIRLRLGFQMIEVADVARSRAIMILIRPLFGGTTVSSLPDGLGDGNSMDVNLITVFERKIVEERNQEKRRV